MIIRNLVKFVGGLLLALQLSHCATMTNQQPQIEYDKFSAAYVVTGGRVEQGSLLQDVLTESSANVWMRGTFNNAGADQLIQLYVQRKGKGTQFYQSASDSTGTPLKVQRLKTYFGLSPFGHLNLESEDLIAIDLPRDFINARSTQGLEIRAIGHNQVSLVVKVPSVYIVEFLQTFDNAVAQKR